MKVDKASSENRVPQAIFLHVFLLGEKCTIFLQCTLCTYDDDDFDVLSYDCIEVNLVVIQCVVIDEHEDKSNVRSNNILKPYNKSPLSLNHYNILK